MAYKQPARTNIDGPLSVHRLGTTDLVEVTVETNGTVDQIVCTEFNASRMLAMLAVVLGVRIHVQDAKAIRLG